MALSLIRQSPFSTISRACCVISLSMLLRSLLFSFIFSPICIASWVSVAVSSSTARRPVSILPAALMRGPILKTMSSIVRWPGSSIDSFIIARRPLRGFSFSCLRPKCASTLFSPTIDTRSAEMLTTSRSSSGMRDSKGMP